MARTFVWHPGKGPKTTKALKIGDGARVRVKQVRSGIGHSWRMRATLEAIGLRHHQAVIEKAMTPALRGQLTQVRHLVEVTEIEGEGGGRGEEGVKTKAKRAKKKEAVSG
jgi:large subunit ribosomal protein L30